MIEQPKTRLSAAIRMAQISCVTALAIPGAFAAPVVSDGGYDDSVVDIADPVANGEGEQVTTVSINTDLTQIDWTEFNIAETEIVDFLFSQGFEDNGIVVNNILTGTTKIDGSLTSNGHVVLINPRGVLFSEGSSVNVAALTVAALGAPSGQFDGQFSLSHDAGLEAEAGAEIQPGQVLVNGTLHGTKDITLIGRSVGIGATGHLRAGLYGGDPEALLETGTINLFAAETVTLTLAESRLYSVAVDSEALQDELDLDAGILNEGTISGATVVMDSRVADSITSAAINNSGTITATGIDTSGGTIRLSGSGGGVINSNTLSVATTATDADAIAGSITVSADHIENAQAGAILADAAVSASGGQITLDTSGRLLVDGTVSAQGAGSGFSGGNVLTQSDSEVVIEETATVTTQGIDGADSGRWEVASTEISVGNDCAENCLTGSQIESALSVNGEVELHATGDAEGQGSGIVLANPIETDASGRLSLRSNSSVTIQRSANGNQPDVDIAELAVSAGSDFENSGIVRAESVEIAIGANGLGSDSALGNLASGTEFLITGGDGIDTISVAGMSDNLTLDVDADAVVTVSVNAVNDSTVLGSLTGIDAVTADSADTLSGTEQADFFTLQGDGGVESNNVIFSGIGTLDGLGGTDTLTGQDGVDWTLSDLANGFQDGIRLDRVELLAAQNAGLSGVERSEVFNLDADGNISVDGGDYTGYTFTNLTSVDTGEFGGTLNAADWADFLYLTNSAGTLSTTDTDVTGGITFTGLSSVTTSQLDASALGGSALFMQNDAGSQLSTTAVVDDGFAMDGLSEVRGVNLNTNGTAATFSLAGAGSITTGADSSLVSFNEVTEIVGGSDVTVVGGSNWSLDASGRASESANGVLFSGQWLVEVESGATLTAEASGSGFTLVDDTVAVDDTSLSFSNLGTVQAQGTSTLDALGLGDDFLYFNAASDTASTVAAGESGGIDFVGFAEIAINKLSALGDGVTLYMRNNNGSQLSTAADSGTLFTDLNEVEVGTLETNGQSARFALAGANSVTTGSDSALISFRQVSEIVGSAAAEVSGGTWALDTDGATETTSSILFSEQWSVLGDGSNTLDASGLGDAYLFLTDTSGTVSDAATGGIRFSDFATVTATRLDAGALGNADLYLRDASGSRVSASASSGTVISGLSEVAVRNLHTNSLAVEMGLSETAGSVTIGADTDRVTFTQVTEVESSAQGRVTGGSNWGLDAFDRASESANGVLFSGQWAVAAESGATLTAAASGNGFTLVDDTVAVDGTSITFSNLGAVQAQGNSTLDALALGDDFLYLNASSDTASTVAAGETGGLDFFGFTEIAVNKLSAQGDGVSLYMRNDSGSALSTAADSGTLFTNLNEVEVGTLETNGQSARFALAGANRVTTGSDTSLVAFNQVSGIILDAGAEVAGGTSWSVVDTGRVSDATNGIGFSGEGEINAADGATLAASASGNAFELEGDAAGVSVSGLVLRNLDSVTGGGTSTLSANLAEGNFLYLADDTGGISTVAAGESGGIAFEGFSQVNVNRLNAAGNALYLQDASGSQASATQSGGTLFASLEQVVVDVLHTNGFATELSVAGVGEIRAADTVRFENVSEVVGGANAYIEGSGSWTLDTTGATETASGILFSQQWLVGGDGSGSLDARALGDSSLYLKDTSGRVSTAATDTDSGIEFSDFSEITVASLDASALGDSALFFRNVTGSELSTQQAGGVAFSGLSDVVVQRLDTNGNAVSLGVLGAGSIGSAADADAVVFNDVVFNGVAEVAGSAGANLSGSADWALQSTGVQESVSSIVFSGPWSVTAGSGSTLTGTGDMDSFALDSAGNLRASDLTFTGLGSVVGNGGADILDARLYGDGVTLSDSVNTVSVNDIEFSGLSAVRTEQLNAAAGGSSFVLTGGGVRVGALLFTDLVTVSGGTGESSLDALALGDEYLYLNNATGTAVSTGASADTSAIHFVNLSTIDAARLDTSEVSANMTVTSGEVSLQDANAAIFSSVTEVRGDADDSVTGVGDWALSGTSGATFGSVLFSGSWQVTSNGGVLTGTDDGNEFLINSNGSIEANDLVFNDLQSVVGGSGRDIVDAANYMDGVELTGADFAFSIAGIGFSNMESVVTSVLNAAAGGSTFTWTDSGLTADQLEFSGLETVVGSSGTDSVSGLNTLVLGADDLGTYVTDENDTIAFHAIDRFDTQSGSLTETIGGNTITLTDRNAVSVSAHDFTGLSSLIANAGGNLDASNYADGLFLTGNTAEVTSAVTDGLTFTGIDSATVAKLTGSALGESFTAVGPNSVAARQLQFDGVSEVVAGSDAAQAIGAIGAGWLLDVENDPDQVTNSSIAFSGFTQFVARSAGLSTTGGNNAFVLSGSESEGRIVSIGDLEFSGLDSVDAGGESDSLNALGYTDSLFLTGAIGGLGVDGLTFTNFETAQLTDLVGSFGADHFDVIGEKTVTVAGLQISGLDTVDGGNGTDFLTGLDVLEISEDATIASGIVFTGLGGELSSSVIRGTNQNDEILFTASGEIFFNGELLGAFEQLDALGGDDTVTGAEGQEWTLTGDGSATSGGHEFLDIEYLNIDSAGLNGTSAADAFVLNADGDLVFGTLTVSGMTFVDAGASVGDSLDASTYIEGLQLTDTAGLLQASGLELRGFESAATGLLTGTGNSDTFKLGNDGLDAGGILITGLTRIVGGTGDDRIESDIVDGWILSDTTGEFEHGTIEFAGIETAAGGDGTLQTTAGNETLSLGSDGFIYIGNLVFEGLTSVDAGGGTDSVATESGLQWVMNGDVGTASVGGVSFNDIERVSTANAALDTTSSSGPLRFELGADSQQVSVLDILFDSVAEVIAAAATGDTVASEAGEWQLGDTANRIVANNVTFSGVDNVETRGAQLSGTTANDHFSLTGSPGGVSSAGMTFTGIDRVAGAGGKDSLSATVADDTFTLFENGDVRTAAVRFTGLAAIDTGEGTDTVNGTGATWTSGSGDSAVFQAGTAIASVDSLTVLFENLERVGNAGTYTGPAVSADYHLTAANSLEIGGVEFAGLENLIAGGDASTLHGIDSEMNWSLDGNQGTLANNQASLNFSGFSAIIAGSGADHFELNGSTLTSLDTGDGNDTVSLQQTNLDTLILGAGDDVLSVLSASQPLTVIAGEGQDEMQMHIAAQTWLINGDGSTQNRVGNIAFRGFEQLLDSSSGLSLDTNQQFNFLADQDGGALSAGVDFSAAGMTIAYDPSGDVVVSSRNTGLIGGKLQGNRAQLTLAGDLDIASDMNTLAVATSGPDIDVSIVADQDLVIDQINVGRGDVSLASAAFGTLTAESFGDTHIIAGNIELGTETQRWGDIGTEINPLRMDANQSVRIVALSYYEPAFIGQQPQFTATGDRLQSVAGAQTAQGLKSAVQTPAEDITQLDPGIFDEVTPYSLGLQALNAPEMRLTADGLEPAHDLDETEEDGAEEEEGAERESAPVAGE